MQTPMSDSIWGGIEFAQTAPMLSAPVTIDFLATGWQGQLDRGQMLEVDSLTIGLAESQVVPIRLQSKLPPTIGFSCPESPDFGLADSTAPFATAATNSPAEKTPPRTSQVADLDTANAAIKRTRIAPPKDLVKLEDRLYFVLQPPLENLIASARLEFPFPPFPYQFEGIAFLFPREAAILADEMGLGKTMQAITTVRMLLLLVLPASVTWPTLHVGIGF